MIDAFKLFWTNMQNVSVKKNQIVTEQEDSLAISTRPCPYAIRKCVSFLKNCQLQLQFVVWCFC